MIVERKKPKGFRCPICRIRLSTADSMPTNKYQTEHHCCPRRYIRIANPGARWFKRRGL